MIAELSPPGFDNMVRLTDPFSVLFLAVAIVINGGTTNAVLRVLRFVEVRVIHDRAKRDPGDHRPLGQQLERLPVLVCGLHLRESRHLVRCGRAERAACCGAVGCRTAAWDRCYIF